MAPIVIVQARLGSKRLPGKVLKPIRGKPMLGYLLDRLPFDKVVVATPDQEIADFVTDYSDLESFVWDGPEDDVAGRFEACLKHYGNPSTFVRICADSPLMDPALVDAAMALAPGPYFAIRAPVGSVQVVDTAGWKFWRHREHVIEPALAPTLWIGNSYRLVVDTQEDFDRVSAVIGKMDRSAWEYGWRDVCGLL